MKITILLFVFLSVCFIYGQSTIYVKASASGSNNGINWTNAYTSLQSAIEAAANDDQIWVAAGVYKPTKDNTGSSTPADIRTKSFVVDKNLTFYGGFQGTETLLSQRNWETNVTVLSGDLAGDDVNTNGVVLDWSNIVGSDNCYDVVVTWDKTTVFDGFTITGGHSYTSDTRCLPYSCGAGMCANYGNTTLRNMVFRGNYGDLKPGGAVYFWEGTGTVNNVDFIGNSGCQGGAAYSRNAAVTFTNVLFQDNEARDPAGASGTASVSGGGAFLSGSNNIIDNAQFINNVAARDGGGLSVFNGITISNTLFQGNYSSTYGGGMWDEGSIMTNVSFISNTAGQWGGGLVARSTGTYNGLVFTNNSAVQRGGGIYCEGSDAAMTNCTFNGNSAPYGGAIFLYTLNPVITNAVFRNNSASGSYGSIIYNCYGIPVLTNVTISGNSDILFYNSGAEYIIKIRNSIIWGNSGSVYGGYGDMIEPRYCVIQGPAWGTILNSDPKFVDETNGDFQLQSTSPAIDSGNNTVTNPALPAVDLAGNTRCLDNPYVTDTGLGTAPIVDMGAYEFDPESLPVELISFKADVIEGNVQLIWQTATEVNNYGFSIERSVILSPDPVGAKNLLPQDWQNIGFVEGSGNSNSTKQYSFIDKDIINGSYSYRLKQIDTDGSYSYSNTIDVTCNLLPSTFKLFQNYPNPFNPATVISFQLPVVSKVQLRVYDILGNEVATLVNEQKSPGYYEVKFDGSKLASGVYIYQLNAGNFVQTKKLLLMK